MKLSFEKFFALTMTLAAGTSLATGCATDDTEGGGGAGSAGTSETGGSGGSGESNGGEAGASGSGAAVAGSSGAAVAGSAGQPSSEGGGAGSAGQPSSEGGGAGSAGQPSSEGGGAGSAGQPSSEGGGAGSAGQPSSEGGGAGTAGTAGASAGAGGESCVSGDPAYESGVDCYDLLPYSEEECPSPSGEGVTAPAGLTKCWQHAEDRVDSVAVLTDCLAAIDGSDVGYCGEGHQEAVDACVAEMEARTCPSAAAEASCANIHAACSEVAVDACVAGLSMVDDTRITYIEGCASGEGEALSSTCAYQYRVCKGDNPDQYLTIDDACAKLTPDCSGVNDTECAAGFENFSEGSSLRELYYYSIRGCMQAEQEENSLTCSAAFETCSAGA